VENEAAWPRLGQAFEALNRECSYLVLRNFEQFRESAFLAGHDDMDLLCDDRAKLRGTLRATARFARDGGVHCTVSIGSVKIPVDIRTVGDGYYDKR